MKQLIDVEFKDVTSYPSQPGTDVGAIVIDCPWGPAAEVVVCDFSSFLATFPLFSSMRLSDSHVTAYKAFLSGLSQCEVYRYPNYKQAFIAWSAVDGASTAPTLKAYSNGSYFVSGSDFGFALKYPGLLEAMVGDENSGSSNWQVKVTLVTTSTIVPGYDDIRIEMQHYDVTSTTWTTLEVVEGSSYIQAIVDGQNLYIGDLLRSSQYFTPVFCDDTIDTSTLSMATTTFTFSVDLSDYKTSVTASTMLSEYSNLFTDIENSSASILIDFGSTSATEANYLIAAAAKREDAVALVGYPIASSWAKADIMTSYKPTLTPSMFGAFYACREIVNLYGRNYTLNGIGTIAGRMCAVAQEECVNQLPSARTWGSFPGTLAKTFAFDDVLEMQKNGVNSVYSTTTGARIFGLRSLYTRASSYYSKFNVGRVCARILKYAYSIAMDAIHTGNTDSKKQTVQNLLNNDLRRLIGQGNLKAESTVVCDKSNNQDIDTNGGEILIIDYTCYFVKLIERVNIRITATDTSVSATLS
jgi:hypothetical protein